MTTRRRFLAAAAAAAFAPRSFAQDLPRQISIVVGFPAGGATDLVARLIGDGLRRTLAPAVIVENRPGASGRVGVEYVKSARNDGSVLLFTPAFPMLISPHLYPKLGYDTLRDFVAVGSVARSMLCFAVGPAVPAAVTGIAAYVDWVKANPRQALFGAPSGSSQHFCGQLLGRAVGVPLQHVPYKGGAPAMQDLIGGHLPANASPVAEALPHHQAGKIRILAVAGVRRSRFLPEVPSLAELGYREVVFQDWLGVFAPAGTPPAVAARLYAAMAETVNAPEGVAALGKFGMETDAAGPDAFPGIVKADWERYRAIVNASGFKAED